VNRKREANLRRAPLFCKSNGYPTVATSQLCYCLIPENGVWMPVKALIESEGLIFRNEDAWYLHHRQLLPLLET